MTSKWQYISNMNYDWWNEPRMVEWNSNYGVTFKWWNDIQMMEWHSNDGMTFKWWNDIQMMEWHSNDKIMSEWAWNELFGTKGYYYPRPPPFVPTVCQKLMIFNGIGGSRLTITLVSDQIWPLASHPQRLHHYFHTHNLYIWMTKYLSEWASNDGMTFKWWNDIQMIKWHSNDGIILKWLNDTWMMK